MNNGFALVCSDQLESMPILSQGRVKPLKVVAEESMRYLTGTTKPHEVSSVVSFCELSLANMGFSLAHQYKLLVEQDEVKTLLEIPLSEKHASIPKVYSKESVLRMEMDRIKESTPYKKEIIKLLSRYELYNKLAEGMMWTVPLVNGSEVSWMSLPQYLSQANLEEFTNQKTNPLGLVLEKAKSDYIKAQGDRYLLELTFNKLAPFKWAMFALLLSFLLITIFKSKAVWHTSITMIFLIELAGMIMRVLISGRAPITNMYETVMFSGFGAFTISVVLYFIYKQKIYLYAGLGVNMLALFMMSFATSMLDPAISPLVPVLRDNFWLSTHVTTVISSYAALSLSWILANIVMFKKAFRPNLLNEKLETELVYNCIKVGVVLLSAGIILGGIWADYSWGRFWGWDPKETWSLIVLLIYIAILHGKYSQWIPPKRFIPLTAIAFLTVMMAWFGVNYILASGLHSYGFSEGGAIFLGSFFLSQLIYSAIIYLKIRSQPN